MQIGSIFKKAIVSLTLASLLLIPSLSQSSATVPSKTAVETSQNLYLVVACKGDDGTYIIGSAFPVEGHLAATAGHVPGACSDDGGELEISIDRGSSYFPVRWEDQIFTSTAFDLAFIVTPSYVVPFKTVAKFRAPTLGEVTTGFGSAFGENGILSRGIIVRVAPNYDDAPGYYSTNSPIGGFSGSALVGDDGAVIGMINWGRPDHRVGGALSGGYAGDFLKAQLASFKGYLNGVHAR